MHNLDGWESVFAWTIFAFLAWMIGGRIALAVRTLAESPGADGDIRDMLRRAANQMAVEPPTQEAAYVTYLLETLGSRVDSNAYRQLLEAVERDVHLRLEASIIS